MKYINLFLIMFLTNALTAQNFTIGITASSSDGAEQPLTFGMSPGATDGFDEGIDNYAPPAPPSGFDVALAWGGDRYFTQILAPSTAATVMPIDVNELYSFSWDPAAISAAGTFTLTDNFGGMFVNVDMSTTGYVDESSSPQWSLISTFHITFTAIEAVNVAPTAVAGEDQTVAPPTDCDAGTNTATVTLDGCSSTDSDGTITAYQWDDSGGTSVGTTCSVEVSLTGDETYTLEVTDDGGLPDTDDVSITVTDEVNTDPVADAGGPIYNATDSDGDSTEVVTLDGSGSTDSEGCDLTYEWTWSGGSASGVTVTDNFPVGTTTVSLMVIDPYTATDISTADVVVTEFANEAPVAAADSYSINEDTDLIVDAASGVLANDSDPDNAPDPLSAILSTDVANGTLTFNSDGSFIYSPNADFNVEDGFTYYAYDGVASSSITAVTLTVNPVNDAPVIGTIANQAMDEDASLELALSASDVDGDVLTFNASSDNTDVSASVEATMLTLSSSQEYHGSATITVTVTDNGGLTDATSFTLTINSVNDSPTANDDAYSVDEDASLSVDAASGVLANDIDIEGDAMTAELVTNVPHGELTFNSDGSFDYTPLSDLYGYVTFTYMASDGESSSNEATVTITVESTPDYPAADFAGEPVSGSAPLEVSFADMSIPGGGVPGGFAGTIFCTNNIDALSVPLVYGFSPVATDGYDDELDEYAPPSPPSGFDAALVWQSERYFTQILAETTEERVFQIALGYPDSSITLSWDSEALQGLGTFILEDVFGGISFSVNMLEENSLLLEDPAYDLLNLKVTPSGGDRDGDIVAWAWDFGDGGTSDERNPSHIYEDGGIYTVSLTVTDEDGLEDTMVKEDFITVLAPPMADFEGDPTEGDAPLTVTFTDLSVSGGGTAGGGLFLIEILTDDYGEETTWELVDENGQILGSDGPFDSATLYTWEFELDAGTYTWTIYDEWGDGICCDWGIGYYNLYLDDDMIATGAEFDASENVTFTAGGRVISTSHGYYAEHHGYAKGEVPADLDIPTIVESIEYSSRDGDIVAWDWDFGDGGTSSEQNPVYTYNDIGVYTVSLTVSDESDLSDSLVKEDYITVNALTVADNDLLPNSFALYQNYPNPFNPETILRYDVPEAAHVQIVIYDVLGREVITLVDKNMQAGRLSVLWNGLSDSGGLLPAGVYIAKLTSENFTASIKLVMMK
tara:strand:+ start:6833 stop:10429 length:3597 start_codon:yes stop_codon:yes gene_type:complete